MTDNLQAVAGHYLIQMLSLPITSAMASITLPITYWISKELLYNLLGIYPNFKHNIMITSQFIPYMTTCHPIPFSKYKVVLKEIQVMINASIWSPIDKAESIYTMVYIAKKDSSLYITRDLSLLNIFILPDRHPMLLIEGILL